MILLLVHNYASHNGGHEHEQTYNYRGSLALTSIVGCRHHYDKASALIDLDSVWLEALVHQAAAALQTCSNVASSPGS